MSGLATLTLVWLGSQSPSAEAKSALDVWAGQQGAKIEEATSPPKVPSVAPASLAAECDRALDQARDQLNGGDDEDALVTLRRLEQTLRDHSEILQASWLMAERWRLEARASSASSGESSARLRERAAILEGERAIAFGEADEAKSHVSAPVSVTLAVQGARTHEIFWDGRYTADTLETLPGEHHLVVLRGGEIGWSGWVSAFAATSIEVWVPPAPARSSDDLAGVSLAAPKSGASVAIVGAKGVRCPAWVAATTGDEPGTLRLASCSGEQCRPPVTWVYEDRKQPPEPAPPATASRLPAWAAWTLAGVGVVATTSIVLWRAGAFDRSEPPGKVVFDPSKL